MQNQVYTEVDLGKALKNVISKWPLFLLCLIIWGVLAFLFVELFPPVYETKMTILVEEPQRMNDPIRYVVGPTEFNPPEDEFFVNEKVIVKSYPLVRSTLDSLGAMVTYSTGGVFKKDLYNKSPVLAKFRPASGKNIEQISEHQLLISLGEKSGVQLKELAIRDEIITKNLFIPFGEWVTIGDVQLNLERNDLTDNVPISELALNIIPIHKLSIEKMEDIEVDAPDFQATVMEITLQGNNPDKDRDFLNLLGANYLNNHLMSKTKMLRKSMSFLDNEIDQSVQDLSDSEISLVTFKSNNQITDLSAESRMLLAQSTKYQNEKLGLKISRKYYDYLKNYVESNDNYDQVITPQAFGVNDELTLKLVNELVELQGRKDNYETSGNTSNPIYKKILTDIEEVKNDIITNIDGFISTNDIRLNDVNQRLADLSSQSKNIPEEERALLQLKRDYDFKVAVQQDLQKKKFEIGLSIASTIPDFEIIEPAYLTDVDPVFPNPIITYGISIFMALSSFFFLLIIIGLFKNNIESKDELNIMGEDTLVHTVYKSNLKLPNELLEYPLSFLGENLKSMLTSYRLGVQKSKGILGMYSYSPGEGKSYLAAQFATFLALNGYKSILIDLDFQNPSLHKLLKLESEKGLSEYCAGELAFEDLIQSTNIDNLSFIPAGTYSLLQIPIHIINEMIGKLKNEFDFVIFDSSPVGIDSSMRNVMTICDLNYFIVSRTRTHKSHLPQIKDIISHVPQSNLNFVFNNVPIKESNFKTHKSYYRNKPKNLFKRVFASS